MNPTHSPSQQNEISFSFMKDNGIGADTASTAGLKLSQNIMDPEELFLDVALNFANPMLGKPNVLDDLSEDLLKQDQKISVRNRRGPKSPSM